MSIDFSLSPEVEAIRVRVRDFITNVVKPEEARIEGHDGGDGVDGRGRLEALIALR